MLTEFPTTLASIFPLTPGNWVDLVCLGLLAICILTGLFIGFSRMLAWLIGMLITLQVGYWLYPTVLFHVRAVVQGRVHPVLAAVLPYLLAVAVGLALFLLLRLLLHRFFKLLVEQPVDRIFGALTGTAQGLMILFFLFSLVSLLPPTNPVRKKICEQSVTGRILTPVVNSVLDAPPEAVIRFRRAKPSNRPPSPKQRPARKARPASRQAKRKP